MDLHRRLAQFESLKIISSQEIKEIINQNRKVMFFGQLVIDVTSFQHPGNQQTLQSYINNPQTDFAESFKKIFHSSNAQLLLCLNVIGVRQINQPNIKGKMLYTRIYEQQKFKSHSKILQKIDFSLPIYEQIDSLSTSQKQLLTQIPKHIANPQKVNFKNSFIQEYKYTNNFWISSITFQLVILFIAHYLLSNYGFKQIVFSLPFFIFGLLKWTLLEYYFHRFELHYDIAIKPIVGDHYMHHVFPNMKNKIALSIHRILLYMIAFYYTYSLFLQTHKVLMLLQGLMVGLTLYDIIHYYCHFGPQIDIKLIKYLKRNHLKHHYRDQTRGFGVSSTLWDKIFKTQHLNAVY